MNSRIKLAVVVGGATIAVALGAAAGAGAASSTYPGHQEARDFHTSDGGWQGSSSIKGTCVPTVSCPTITNDFAANGGTGGQGDGYLRTGISTLAGAQTTSRGVYKSPPFKYTGAKGRKPERLVFAIKRRSQLSALLSVTGNSASFSVDLVDTSQPDKSVGLISPRPIGDQNSWRPSQVSVSPGKLTIGDRYRVRITSKFVIGVQVSPSGSVGYDDVALRARRGGGGHHSLRHQVSDGIGVVHLTRHGLTFKARCPGSARPHKCAMKLNARLSKKGNKITNTRKARLGAAKTRRIRLHLKHRYAKRAHHRKRIWIKANVKVGDRHVNVVKSVRIVKH
jgi:hypothetical protein